MCMQSNGSRKVLKLRTAGRRFSMCLALAMAAAGVAGAVEGGGSVYPLGAETVLPGNMPGAGGTVIAEFTLFYDANELAGSSGRAALPGFHLRVSGAALKVTHNWGVHVLGGRLVSAAAEPLEYVHLTTPGGQAHKVGFSNADLETAVAYNMGALHWWYGFAVYTPGFSYSKTDAVNIGQHNYGTAPEGAFSYLPNHGKTELSSKFQYIVNYSDSATHYRSGNEFVWEYDGMQNVTRNLAIGGNGYFYKQTTNDLQNGSMYLDGSRGRNLAVGPEIRYHTHHLVLIMKYQKDLLTLNRPVGNGIWFELGVPVGRSRE